MLSCIATATEAQSIKPWQWSLADRLRERLEDKNISERLKDAKAFSATGSGTKFVVDGKRNPELFLPSELMAFLLSTLTTDPKQQSMIRAGYRPSITAFGWVPETFWSDLETAANAFMRARQESYRERSEELDRTACHSRIQALKAMRSKYERFDEFLYTAVAPKNMVVSAKPATADWLTWLEGGSQ